MLPLSVFAAHAPANARFAEELKKFLEHGCKAVSFAPDGAIASGEDLMTTADRGLAADVLILVLSPASNLARWSREQWDSLLFGQAAEWKTHVAVLLLEECTFPSLLRRKLKFFDASHNPLPAMRCLKRWLAGLPESAEPETTFSPDLEALYTALADRPGTCTAPGTIAERFAREAASDFEAVLWIPAHGRSLAQIAGDLGSRLNMTLRDPLERNCPRIRDVLAGKRCLLILDAPQVPLDTLLPQGRTSVLLTSDAVEIADGALSLSAARDLSANGRLAEAYEALYRLRDSGVDPEACARELVWICEYWDRMNEANELRFAMRPSRAEQLRLF